MTILCFTGTSAIVAWAVPIEAGMAIVLWIGIVITAQAFQAGKHSHAPAAVLGIMVGVGAFGSLMAKAGIRAADQITGNTLNWAASKDALINAFWSSDIAITGAFSLEQGVIFSAMIFSAVTAYVIDGKLLKAAAWCFAGALLSLAGLIHSFSWSFKDAPMSLTPAWQWAIGYGLMGAIFLMGPFVTTTKK